MTRCSGYGRIYPAPCGPIGPRTAGPGAYHRYTSPMRTSCASRTTIYAICSMLSAGTVLMTSADGSSPGSSSSPGIESWRVPKRRRGSGLSRGRDEGGCMNILVTGGCGFVGTNFVRFELQQHPEDRLVILDALTYAGNLQNLAGLDI